MVNQLDRKFQYKILGQKKKICSSGYVFFLHVCIMFWMPAVHVLFLFKCTENKKKKTPVEIITNDHLFFVLAMQSFCFFSCWANKWQKQWNNECNGCNTHWKSAHPTPVTCICQQFVIIKRSTDNPISPPSCPNPIMNASFLFSTFLSAARFYSSKISVIIHCKS